jgi:hypothetical protein
MRIKPTDRSIQSPYVDGDNRYYPDDRLVEVSDDG